MSHKICNKICIMCNKDTDDQYQFGKKITVEDVTVHYFCLLLSGNLPQNGRDNDGIGGFLIHDIKKEARRAKSWTCRYCKKRGGYISCCEPSCRRTFHLPCGLQNDCRVEFFDRYQSFCNLHHNIQMPMEHRSTESCAICSDEMGSYNIIQSIQPECCQSSSWFHKICLQKYAMTAGYFLKCPMCNDTNTFRKQMSKRGIFIPNCDAEWEQNNFYDFEEHNVRPTKCCAEECKVDKLLKYGQEDEFLMNYCDGCGSKAMHKQCMQKKRAFLCEDCDLEPPSKKQKKNNISDDAPAHQQRRGGATNNEPMKSIDSATNSQSQSKEGSFNNMSRDSSLVSTKDIVSFQPMNFCILVPVLSRKEMSLLLGKNKKRKFNQI